MNNFDVVLCLDNYTIYKNNVCYLCFPNKRYYFYYLFVGFSLFNLEKINEENLYKEIRKNSDLINYNCDNFIYILPIIDPLELEEASLENDYRLYNKLLIKYIHPSIYFVYVYFFKKNIMIDSKINFVKQNDIDKKIIGWLSMCYGDNYIREILINTRLNIDNSVDILYKLDCEDDVNLTKSYSFGFSSFSFMLLIMIISLLLGIFIAYIT